MTHPAAETSTQDVLRGKVAIVTGAGSPRGTGHAMVVDLVKAGARVAMIDISDEWLQQSVADVQSIGGSECARGIIADVSDLSAVERAVATTIASLGGLHVLINNAGTNPRSAGFAYPTRRFWDLPVDAWNRVIAVNLNASFYMIRSCINHMLGQGYGRIIGVTTSMDTMYAAGKSPTVRPRRVTRRSSRPWRRNSRAPASRRTSWCRAARAIRTSSRHPRRMRSARQ